MVNNFIYIYKKLTLKHSKWNKKFWTSVSGSHEDQIYVHVGHLENGTFNLAGKDK